MTNNAQAKKLFEKYIQGKCSIEEQRLVEEWYANTLENEETLELPSDFESKNKELLLSLQQRISNKGKVRKIRYWIAAASVLLVLVSVKFFWPLNERINLEESGTFTAQTEASTFDQPVFQLANGDVIVLDSNQSEIVIDLQSVSYRNGSKIADPSLLDPDGVNHIITPKGKQFEVLLPDSSRVWLNASSSLAYSNRFLAGNREVILEGEAYFEIARDSTRPFRVLSSNQVVSVLGTHFNIKSYEEESVKTTLLEGAIQIESNSSEKVILKPDEESTLQNGKLGFEVRKIKAKDAIAWRDGYFRFDNSSLRSVLNEFSRWYDLEVINELKEDNYEFMGKIDRSLSLDKALKILEIHGVNFKFKNKVLTILDKTKN